MHSRIVDCFINYYAYFIVDNNNDNQYNFINNIRGNNGIGIDDNGVIDSGDDVVSNESDNNDDSSSSSHDEDDNIDNDDNVYNRHSIDEKADSHADNEYEGFHIRNFNNNDNNDDNIYDDRR